MDEEIKVGNWISWEDSQGRREGKVKDSARDDSYNVELEDGTTTAVGKRIVTKIDPPPGKE